MGDLRADVIRFADEMEEATRKVRSNLAKSNDVALIVTGTQLAPMFDGLVARLRAMTRSEPSQPAGLAAGREEPRAVRDALAAMTRAFKARKPIPADEATALLAQAEAAFAGTAPMCPECSKPCDDDGYCDPCANAAVERYTAEHGHSPAEAFALRKTEKAEATDRLVAIIRAVLQSGDPSSEMVLGLSAALDRYDRANTVQPTPDREPTNAE